MELIAHSGPGGLIAIVTTAILFVVGVLLLFKARTLKPMIVLGILALIPLCVGVVFTHIGYAVVEQSFADQPPSEANAEGIKQGRAASRLPGYVGAAGSALILVLAGIGCATRRKPSAQP